MERALSQPRSPGQPETGFRLFLTPQAAALAVVGAACWLAVLWWARSMAGMGMALPTAAFVASWVLMMAAMMLPSVAPVASLYARSVSGRRWPRLAQFGGAYLVVWALTAIPALLLSEMAVRVWPMESAARAIATTVLLAGFAVYQLSPLKSLCLRHCRSPLSSLLHYAGYSGALRDVRAGAHHAAYCVGCCWALMVLLIAVGAMNLPAMLVVTALVLLEKYLPRGLAVAPATAALAFVAAVLVLRFPQLAVSFGAM
jgi:predicted metal-binding membrane protein